LVLNLSRNDARLRAVIAALEMMMNTQGNTAAVRLDPSFGSGGILGFGLPDMDYLALIAIGPAKEITAVGLSALDSHSIILARFDADGVLDTSFGEDGVAVCELFPDFGVRLDECVLLPDSRLLVVGTRRVTGGSLTPVDFFFACVLPDGRLDPAFGDGGTLVVAPFARNRWAHGLVVQPDGKPVALFEGHEEGTLTLVNAFVRLDHAGRPDPAFGDGGFQEVMRGDSAYCCAALPDGRLLAGGYRNGFATVSRFSVAGEEDLSFGFQGSVDLPLQPGHSMTAERIVLQADGRILCQGNESDEDHVSSSYVMKLRPDGERDHTFNRGEPVAMSTHQDRDVLIDAAGRVFCLERNEVNDQFSIVSLTPDGFIEDAGFPLPFAGTVHHYPPGQLLAQVPGTLLVAAPILDTATSTCSLAIARLLT